MEGGGERPREKLTPSQEAKAIRRLNAALGIQTPTDQAVGLLLGCLVAALALLGVLFLGTGAADPVYGTVVGFGLHETQVGSLPLARVEVDQREVVVSLPWSMSCNVGDRIQLLRGKALLGYRYWVGWGGCAALPPLAPSITRFSAGGPPAP